MNMDSLANVAPPGPSPCSFDYNRAFQVSYERFLITQGTMRAPSIGVRATYVYPDGFFILALAQLNDIVLCRRNKQTLESPPFDEMCDWGIRSLTYLQGGVSERSRDAFCMRQALCLILWRLVRGRREGRVYVVVREQLLDHVELPVRDGLVKPQDGAELWRRVGECHGHGVG